MSISKEEKDIFCFYATRGHIDQLNEFLETTPNIDSKLINNALILATKNGKKAIVERLLEDPRADPTFHHSLALRNAVKGGHTNVVKVLLEDGRIEADVFSDIPLLIACYYNYDGIVELLLQHEDVNPAQAHNLPIRLAYYYEYPNIIELLKDLPEVEAHPSDDRAVNQSEIRHIEEEIEHIVDEEDKINEERNEERDEERNEERNEDEESDEEGDEEGDEDSDSDNDEDTRINTNKAEWIDITLANNIRENTITFQSILDGELMVQLDNNPKHIFLKEAIDQWWDSQRKEGLQITNPLSRNPITNISQIKLFRAKWDNSKNSKNSKKTRKNRRSSTRAKRTRNARM